ncbi:uncharacterized protein ARMOST_02635 [Armillaria ostoyae]|uniref:Uncharacterized protein n=1 Tax=Armillaria ostoyae TaxID=47428 RepID=A0A284QS85_ARMOS|nr:uncharacterized protein ARMOST_02635 [Armillaria ostoyae]
MRQIIAVLVDNRRDLSNGTAEPILRGSLVKSKSTYRPPRSSIRDWESFCVIHVAGPSGTYILSSIVSYIIDIPWTGDSQDLHGTTLLTSPLLLGL